MTRDTFPSVISMVVAALCTLAIIGALIYLAAFQGDHDSKLALIAMVSASGASAGTAASLVLVRPRTPVQRAD